MWTAAHAGLPRSLVYHALKRILDLAGAVFGLAFTGLLYPLLALAIKLDSPGSVLFGQERLGWREQPFRVYKFRSMLVTPAAAGDKPLPGDERVTRVGRFLRRTSLDELPQFYNIFRGEMSLVGPRPELPALAVHYSPAERRRFLVKPGLTGWWQVHGRPQPMYCHAAYDLYYVDHRSMRLDLIILWRTLTAVVSGAGAV